MGTVARPTQTLIFSHRLLLYLLQVPPSSYSSFLYVQCKDSSMSTIVLFNTDLLFTTVKLLSLFWLRAD